MAGNFSSNFKANAIIAWALLGTSGMANAGMHFTLSGSHSVANAGYQKIETGAGSGTVDVDLGEYFRIGFTHREELASTTGYAPLKRTDGSTYKDSAGAERYGKFASLSKSKTNSVDLTIVLYAGDIITPYIFGGIAQKSYDIETQSQYVNESGEVVNAVEKTQVSFPTPSGGAGLAIRLSQKFSLKMSHTMTMGMKQLPGEPLEKTTDGYSQVGISFAF
jgi:hypothetical protein